MKYFLKRYKGKVVSCLGDNKGLSLVELLIFVALLGVLIGVCAPMYFGHKEGSRIDIDMAAVKKVIGTVNTAVVVLDVVPDDIEVKISINGGVTTNYPSVQNEINVVLGAAGESIAAATSNYFQDKVKDITLGVAFDGEAPFVYLKSSLSVASTNQLSYDLKCPKSTTISDVVTTNPGGY